MGKDQRSFSRSLVDLTVKIRIGNQWADCKVAVALAERWIRIDSAFKHCLVKSSLDKYEKRFFTDEILRFPKPR